MNNRTEQWKSIKGYEGRYEVSNKGRVRSLNWNRSGQIKVLSSNPNPKTGYIQIGLYQPETKRSISKYIHRLVAEAFLPNPNNLEQVDHIDGNKAHNSVSNLRWCSRKFNNSRKRTKMLKSQNRTNTSHTHQFVKATSKDGEVRYFKTINAASRQLGFSHVLGIKVIRGEFNTAKDWKLEYIDRASEEGKNANVDVKTKAQKKAEIMKRMRAERKAHVREIGLEPKMAKCVMQINLTGDIVGIYPNVYTAEKEKGLRGILECIFGLRETVGNHKWDWVFG